MIAVAAQQGVLLAAGLAAVVDEVGDAVAVALIGNDADVAAAEGDDIPRLPCGDVLGVKGQAFGVAAKKHPQIGHPPKIDIGVWGPLYPRIKGGISGDIGVDHRLEVVPRILEGTPHHIGADPAVFRRVAPGKVGGVVFGVVFGVLPGAQQDIGVVIDAVAVGVQGALQRFDAEMLRCISFMGQKVPVVQHR